MPTLQSISSRAALAGLFFVAAGCTDNPVATQAAVVGPIILNIVSGDAQTALANTELPNPLVVVVTDDKGHPARDQIVNFRVVQGGGSMYAGASLTNKDGIAQDWWTLGASGAQVVEVRAVDPTTGDKKLYATFTATIGAPPPPPPPVIVPDSYEPNDQLGSRLYATFNSNGGTYPIDANFHSATDVDYYGFSANVSNSNCVFGPLRVVTASAALIGVPVGQTYRISILDGAAIMATTTLVGDGSTTTGVQYQYGVPCGQSVQKTLSVEMERIAGDFTASHYSLLFSLGVQ